MSLPSLHGGFLKPKLLREIPDPVTGYPLRWEAADGAQSVTTDHPHVVDHVQLSSSLVDFSAKIPPDTFRREPFFWVCDPEHARSHQVSIRRSVWPPAVLAPAMLTTCQVGLGDVWRSEIGRGVMEKQGRL